MDLFILLCIILKLILSCYFRANVANRKYVHFRFGNLSSPKVESGNISFFRGNEVDLLEMVSNANFL